jgi:hypothetical protein
MGAGEVAQGCSPRADYVGTSLVPRHRYCHILSPAHAHQHIADARVR